MRRLVRIHVPHHLRRVARHHATIIAHGIGVAIFAGCGDGEARGGDEHGGKVPPECEKIVGGDFEVGGGGREWLGYT